MSAGPTTLRADAARNRIRILDAARELFARDGLDVSMREIARHAEVGEPTLRRRFPTRQTLVAEAFEDKVALYADLADAACDDPDPARGFRQFLTCVTDMQVVDRGFADVLTMTFPAGLRCETHRQRSAEAIGRLVARARAAGVVREEFVAEDVVLLLLAHAGVVAGADELAQPFSARLRAYLCEAFGLPPVDPMPAAPSASQVDRALQRRFARSPSATAEARCAPSTASSTKE